MKPIRILLSIVALVILANLLISGCEDNHSTDYNTLPASVEKVSSPVAISVEPIETANLEIGRVDIVSCAIDSLTKSVEIKLHVFWKAGGDEYLVFRAGYTSTGSKSALITNLSNTSRNLLWEYLFVVDTNKITTITERSSNDQLTMVFDNRDPQKRIENHIDRRGRVTRYEYPPDLLDRYQFEKASLSKEENLLIASMQSRFASSYDSNGSLNNNKYGHLVTEMISVNIVKTALGDQVSVSNPEKVTDLEAFCAGLCIATGIKCIFGAIFNPFCDGLALACLACEIAVVIANAF
jgi:hypothetical protein